MIRDIKSASVQPLALGVVGNLDTGEMVSGQGGEWSVSAPTVWVILHLYPHYSNSPFLISYH